MWHWITNLHITNCFFSSAYGTLRNKTKRHGTLRNGAKFKAILHMLAVNFWFSHNPKRHRRQDIAAMLVSQTKEIIKIQEKTSNRDLQIRQRNKNLGLLKLYLYGVAECCVFWLQKQLFNFVTDVRQVNLTVIWYI